jgi:hypothetical protein
MEIIKKYTVNYQEIFDDYLEERRRYENECYRIYNTINFEIQTKAEIAKELTTKAYITTEKAAKLAKQATRNQRRK